MYLARKDVFGTSMLHQNPSADCRRCYDQRIKCDRRKPICQNCEEAGIHCVAILTEARSTSIRRVEEQRAVLQCETSRGGPSEGVTSTLPGRYSSVPSAKLTADHGHAAMTSFHSNFAVIDPGYEAHGLADIIREGYITWPADSPAALAAETVALELSSMKHAGQLTESTTRHVQGRALRSIKGALREDATALCDETLLAVLLLHFHANVSSYKNLSKGSSNHQDGARALVSSRGQRNFESQTSRRLLQAVRSHLISSAIRSGERLELDPAIWNSSSEGSRPKPVELDKLGLTIAGLKADYIEMTQPEPSTEATGRQNNRTKANALLTKAVTADLHLRTWEASLTLEWFPASVVPSDMDADQNSSPDTMNCETVTRDTYSSIEVADTMNRYRVYRLICLQVMWSCHLMQDRDESRQQHPFRKRLPLGSLNDSDVVTYQVQRMTDQICNSVAFHLRNDREAKTHLAMAGSGSSKLSLLHNTNETPKASISSGSWYILGPLSFLVQSFSAQPAQVLQPPPLREGQLEWIKTRLTRIMRVHGVIGDLEAFNDDHVRRLRESLQYTHGV